MKDLRLNILFKFTFFLVLGLMPRIFYAQYQPSIDFQSVEANIRFIPSSKEVQGKAKYKALFTQDTTSFFLDAQNIEIKNTDIPKRVRLEQTPTKIIFHGKFKKGKTLEFSLDYTATPSQAMYFYGLPWDEGEQQIWTQGQGKFTSHWLPSLDNPRDKLIFSISVEAPSNLVTLANGQLIHQHLSDSSTRWTYKMNKPMSSYLAALAVGDYYKKEIFTNRNLPLHLYTSTKDSLKWEPTYRFSAEMMDFFEAEIGVNYPWEIYQQVPVRDFLYSGMENTTLTIFSENFVVDSIGFNDHNYVSVNAHEMAHQWFGNLVTAESDEHHWLQEGFATYFALLAEREFIGEEHFYRSLYESAEQLKALSDKGKGEAILRTKASSLTYYQKGAWALHVLREKMGPEKFRLAVKNYIEKHQFSTATTDDFLAEITKVSSVDVVAFKRDWLQQSAFQAEEALTSLKKSLFMRQYLELISVRDKPLHQKSAELSRLMSKDFSSYINQEAVFQIGEATSQEAINLYRRALRSKSLYTKQAVALFLKEIPNELQEDYEQLLLEKSYITIEKALFNLWQNFPSRRQTYLDITKNSVGFQEKNIRQLWLLLALVTNEYEPQNTQKYFQELNNYTNSSFDFNVRKIAFNYLYQLDVFTDQAYLNLVSSSLHPTWVYRDFCKAMLTELASDAKHKQALQSLLPEMTNTEKELVVKILRK